MNIILSIDYEIFGDGSGSMDTCMVKPLDNMLSIASDYNASLSIFAETLEIQSLLTSAHHSQQANSVCRQLQTACKAGHDVQLHLHPQWHSASVDVSNKSFTLHAENWRIGNVSKPVVEELIKQGKHWLEQLLQPACSDYQCVAFRAGGWCIQPSKPVIEALMNNDLYIDSTVAPGANNSVKEDWYDFRKAPDDLAFWKVYSDVTQPASTGLYELPITTGEIGYLKHLNIILSNMYFDSLAPDCVGSYGIPGIKESALLSKLNQLRKLSKLGHGMLDISTMPAETLIAITQSWQRKFPANADVTAVAIGHTKNFSKRAAIEFEKYLKWADAQNHQFITYQQWHKNHTH
ncbi:MAG: hypothetical protein V3U78_03615 [Thiotrichaceae bacterium]